MSTINSNVLSLLDWAKRLDPKSKVAAIIELLNQRNDIIEDVPFMEGNLPTGNRTTVRTGLPAVAWRMLNAGVPTSKSQTAQIDEQTAMLEAYSEVDKDLAELNGNLNAFRLSEAKAFIESMRQEFASTLFYGNGGTAPEEFTGLSPRYSALSGVQNSKNVITAAGAGADNTSIWLIVWGETSVFGIYPKASSVGLSHEDLGLVTIESANGIGQGTRMRAYRDHWQWKCGLALKDWRYAVRICNIDVSNLVAKSSAADLIELMISAMYRIPNLESGKAAFYMNRTVAHMLDVQRRDEVISGGGLTYDVVDGRRIMAFRGIPIRICDALLESEAVVS